MRIEDWDSNGILYFFKHGLSDMSMNVVLMKSEDSFYLINLRLMNKKKFIHSYKKEDLTVLHENWTQSIKPEEMKRFILNFFECDI